MSRLYLPAAVVTVLICLGFVIFGVVTASWAVVGVFGVIALAGLTAGLFSPAGSEQPSASD